MPPVQGLREFINERLGAAAEEIFTFVQQTIVEFQEENDRQRRLLELVLKPQVKIHRIELPPPEKEVPFPEPPQIKEEPEKLCTSLDQDVSEPPQIKTELEEQFVIKQETETFTLTSICHQSDNSEDQTLDLTPDETQSATGMDNIVITNVRGSVEPEPDSEEQLPSHHSHVAESQDHKGGKHGDSGSNGNVETKPRTRRRESKSHSDTVCNPTITNIQPDMDTELPQQLCDQERDSSLDHDVPEPPQIKEEPEELCTSLNEDDPVPPQINEEQEELCTSLERDQVVKNQETETFTLTSTCDERDNNKGGKHGKSESIGNVKPKSRTRRHESKSHSDTVCNLTITNIQLDMDTGERVLCETCGKAFKNIHGLNIHRRVHTGEKPYNCKICRRRFREMTKMKVHMRTHKGEKPYACNTCKKRFSSQNSLHKHMRLHTGEKPYLCNTCGRRFSEPGTLKAHIRTHTGEKPYTCKTCDKRFSRLNTLKEHMRIHTGEKPYTCNTCEKRFCKLSTLIVHIRTHTGEKPYTCKTCKKPFSHLYTLKEHMIIHTGEKPYTCNTCKKGFTRLFTLKEHMRTHTCEKPVEETSSAVG